MFGPHGFLFDRRRFDQSENCVPQFPFSFDVLNKKDGGQIPGAPPRTSKATLLITTKMVSQLLRE